ncbi:MAG: hypothetical protein M3385_08760 [Actinomycetota bacterium]|nr:hypothetical protein [Actinomycetota bacterium]
MGGRHEAGVGGELVGALEGAEVSHAYQELGTEDQTHAWQASEYPGLGRGEKPLPELPMEVVDTLLEGERLFGEFGEIGRLVTGSSPKLLVGAVEVRSGEVEVFRDAEVTAEKILASCALPMLFRAVRIGEDGVYWDGLFSQNPPIRDFMREFPDATTKPDEI